MNHNTYIQVRQTVVFSSTKRHKIRTRVTMELLLIFSEINFEQVPKSAKFTALEKAHCTVPVENFT